MLQYTVDILSIMNITSYDKHTGKFYVTGCTGSSSGNQQVFAQILNYN